MRRNPERRIVDLTMFGVMVLIFHFIILRRDNGSCSTRASVKHSKRETRQASYSTLFVFGTEPNGWRNVGEQTGDETRFDFGIANATN